jgi:glycine/D-amino acid oxidase-like deaminating enzyme
VREFRKLDATTPVVLVTADTGDFYGKPSLSTALAQGRTPAQLVTMPADQMRETLNVTVMAHTHITRLDVQAQAVHTSEGVLTYRDLVLATGAHPIRLSLGGNAAAEVMSVNDLASYTVFRQSLSPQARVLVIGAGLIGCEFANDLVAKHYAVQVVDPNAVPLAALLPEAVGAQLQAALQALGVLLTVWWPSLAGFALGSLLLGLPFTAITLFAMQEARRLRPAGPSAYISLLTAAYGLGQIAGPPLAAALLHHSASTAQGFDRALRLDREAVIVKQLTDHEQEVNERFENQIVSFVPLLCHSMI